jgi:hypothetical protein
MSDCLRFRFGTAERSAEDVHLRHDFLPRTGRARQRSCARSQVVAIRLSKIYDYLADNIYVHILSRTIGGVQEETERTAELFPKSGHGELGSCGRGKVPRRLSLE